MPAGYMLQWKNENALKFLKMYLGIQKYLRRKNW